MNTLALIQESIYIIEDELLSELSASYLAKKIGYSRDHFERTFKQFVGMPLMTYVKKRRLEWAINRIKEGESVIDVALNCGFDTHAGFYKAFRKQYGCSPSKYLKLNTVGPTTPLDLLKESKKLMNKNKMLTILKNWDIRVESKDIDKLDLSHALRGNHTYKIKNYIFKSDVNKSDLMIQIKLGKALKAYNINAPFPIKTITGDDYVVIEDVYYMVYHFLEGDILTIEERYNGDCIKLGTQIGSALGKLHLVLKNLEDDIDIHEADFKSTILNWALPKSKNLVKQWNIKLPENFFEIIESTITDNYQFLITQLIHRDPNPTNYIFKDGEFNGFIDFEIAEKNIRIFDVGYALTGLFIDSNQVACGIDKWDKLRSGLINGYNQVNPLTDSELEILPYVMLSIQLIFIVYLEETGDQLEMLKRNHEMLEELAEKLL